MNSARAPKTEGTDMMGWMPEIFKAAARMGRRFRFSKKPAVLELGQRCALAGTRLSLQPHHGGNPWNPTRDVILDSPFQQADAAAERSCRIGAWLQPWQ